MPNTETVIAVYRPHGGKDKKLEALLRKHVPALKNAKYVTDRLAVVLKSRIDGSYIEIFEWVSAEAVERAHNDPEIQRIWRTLGENAEFSTLGSLGEAGLEFPHFDYIEI